MTEQPFAPGDSPISIDMLEALEMPARLAALGQTRLLDTDPEEAFDRLTRTAARVFHVPLALVNLVDDQRQFSKSCFAPDFWPDERNAPLADSFCIYAVASAKPVIIEDARENPRFAKSTFVTQLGVTSYAGVPLIMNSGQVIGTLCIADFTPRQWDEEEVRVLEDLAAAAVTEIELRLEVAERRRAERVLRRQRALIELLEMVTDTVREARTLQEALDRVVDYACRRLRLPIGHAYKADQDGSLSATVIWYRDAGRSRSCHDAAAAIRTAAPGGLPGRVLASGTTVWVEDVAADPSLVPGKDPAQCGIRSAFAVPVRAQGRTVAVLEFYSSGRISPTGGVLEVAGYAGRQLGNIVEREQAEAGLRIFTQISENLHAPLAELRDQLEALTGILRNSADSRAHHFAMLALDRARRLKRIENELRDRTRLTPRDAADQITEASVQVVDLTLLVARAVEATRQEAEQRVLEVDLPNASIFTEQNAEQLNELVVALLKNAVEHTPETGRIDVGLQPVSATEAELRIRDTGHALSPGKVAKFLSRFYESAHPEGGETAEGSGLLLTEGVVRAESGIASITSSEGEGTTSVLRIPTRSETPEQSAAG